MHGIQQLTIHVRSDADVRGVVNLYPKGIYRLNKEANL